MTTDNTQDSDVRELRDKVVQVLEYNVGNEISDEDHRDITNDLMQLFAAQQKALLERVKFEIATAERMAWIDEEGTNMSVRVFENNIYPALSRLQAEKLPAERGV